MTRGGGTARRPLLWTLAVFSVALFTIERGIEVGQGGGDSPPFFIDEAHKLSEAYYFHLFFEQGDLGNRHWRTDFYARTNPPVAKYIFGSALALTGEHVGDRRLQEDFNRLARRSDELRRLTPDRQLRVTRQVSAFYAAFLCASLFFMARRASGSLAGAVAVVLLLGNRYFLTNARQGMTDSIMLFHLSLIAPASLLAVGALSRRWRRDPGQPVPGGRVGLVLRTVILPGLVIALAAGSKLNGAITAPIYLACLLLAARRGSGSSVSPSQRVGEALVAAGAAVSLALGAFFVINPYFYRSPIAAAIHTWLTYGDWMVRMQLSPGEGLFSIRDRAAVAAQFLFTEGATPLSRWLGAIGPYIAAFAVSFGTVSLLIRRRWVGVDSVDDSTEGRMAAMDAVLVWSLTCLVLPTAWAPVSWDRYFLPPYVAGCLLAGVGASALLRAAWMAIGVRRREAAAGGEALRVGAAALGASFLSLLLVSVAWGRDLDTRPATWSVPGGIPAWSDSARLRRHLGLRALRMGRVLEARAQLELSLSMIPEDPGDGSQAVVQRACLLYDLAGVRSTAGDPKGAIEALKAHVALLERLRDQMKSVDPGVRSSNDNLIGQRKEELARLRDSGRESTPATP